MGLLSKVWGAVDPFVPDEQVVGLLNRFSGRPAPVAAQPREEGIWGAGYEHLNGTPAPVPPPQAPQQKGPGLGRYLEGFLYGQLPGQVRDRYADRQAGEELRQQIRATVTDPRERAVALANPQKWAEENATRYGAHNVAAGNSMVFGQPGSEGSSVFYAPKYGVDEGRAYGVTPDGVEQYGELDPSYGQQTDRMKAENDASGYTLGPGTVRFDRDGNVVARAPFAPRIEQVDPEKDAYLMGGESAAPASGLNVDSLTQGVTAAVPGARITSGYRSPTDNARVGGVPNSYHMSGQAVDVVPPQGMGMGRLAANLKQAFPGFDIINEGDHVHVEPGGSRSQQPQLMRRGQPKPGYRVMSPQEIQQQGLPPGNYQMSPQGQITQIGGQNGNDKKTETDLRKEFDALPEVKSYKTVENAYQNIKGAAGNPSAAGDLSLIFAYMKLLDPDSAVREGEFANAQNAGGVPDRVWNTYNKALNGQRLNPKQRQDFVAQAEGLYVNRRRVFDQRANEYRGYAQDYGVNPERVVPKSAPANQGEKQRFKVSRGGKTVYVEASSPDVAKRLGEAQIKGGGGKSAKQMSNDELRKALGL